MNTTNQEPSPILELEQDLKISSALFTKKKLLIAIPILLLVIGIATAFALTQDKDSDREVVQETATPQTTATPVVTPTPDNLVETAYTGVKEDVITKQTFDCKPTDEHQWYRTDRTLTIDFEDPNTMYINVEWKGIYKSTDGGKTWVQKTKGIKVYADAADTTKGCYSEYPVIHMNPKNNKHLIVGISGGGGGFLNPTSINSQTGGVYQSFDGAETWQLMINDKMNIYVTDAVFDLGNPDNIYYGTTSNPASFIEADQSKLFVTKGLIYHTKDAGKTWEELPTGIGERSGATSILVNPKDSNEILAPTYSAVRQSTNADGTGLSTGKDTSSVTQLGILKTLDGGKTWESLKIPGNPPLIAGFASYTNFKNMFFMTQVSGTTSPGYITLDGGATFKETKTLNVVTYDPFDPTGNHVLGYSNTGGTPTIPALHLWESKDGGVTFKGRGTLPKEIKDLNATNTRPSSIVWHPTDKNTIFMSGAGGKIWKSTNLGTTWTTILSYDQLD